jgi:DNA-binding CsgD family transcriptional regulator
MSARHTAKAEMDDLYPIWSLFDGSSACVAQLDLHLRLIGGNGGFADMFGLPVAALPGRAVTELVHPSVRDKLTRRLLSLARGERNRFTDWVVPNGGQALASLEVTGLAVTNDADQVDSLILLVQEQVQQPAAVPAPVGSTETLTLTRMDALVLEGVAAGMSTVQLAAKLFLSRGGVEYHVSALMKSLDAANRSELVSKAYSARLFTVGSWPPRVIADFVELGPPPVPGSRVRAGCCGDCRGARAPRPAVRRRAAGSAPGR